MNTPDLDIEDPHVGQVLDGRYQIEAAIGHGGMGSVYRARHLELGEPLAVKFLLPDLAAVPSLRNRFRREAIALARLRHPGVVSVLDYGEQAGEPYMVMELLRGHTLAELIDSGAMPLLRTMTVFDHILQVLEAVHDSGIVHRDLKPDNIMVLDTADHADLIKLFDFGLVYLEMATEPRLTESGSVRGTPVYMSPEQCRGTDIGPPSDIYSIGATLYETLSGKPPFWGADAATVMAQQMFVEPPTLVREGLAVTPGIDAVVRRAMEKDPARRPTAREFRVELSQAFRGTDLVSIADAAARDRVREANRSRSERAPTAPALEVHQFAPVEGDVRIWIRDANRTAEVCAALVINGMTASTVHRADDLRDAGVVVISAADGVATLEELRANGVTTPVLVVDIADDPARYIRAGANDISTLGSSDGKLHVKVQRMLRRRR